MIYFFESNNGRILAVNAPSGLDQQAIEKLIWAFNDAKLLSETKVSGNFVGPRKEMITPWSTNAVEITQNMGINSIVRIEEFVKVASETISFDPMLTSLYKELNQTIFDIDIKPEPIIYIDNIDAYNKQEGLALSADEVAYLENLSVKLKRKLTDSEIFGFSQVNSEHCRHKIFNGTFIIDGNEKAESLFKLIKLTTETNKKRVVSAYKDNCAFMQGPVVSQFAPKTQDKPDFFQTKDIEAVFSLKAETHNFPTTVEPFNGAATGSGGEIRDRIAGGTASYPISGTAVYMTSYPRLEGARNWEKAVNERNWLYQTPEEILIKASNGASDFGNKFGQPLICGSVLTFEHFENSRVYGFDKVIMLAGGIGFGNKRDALKNEPQKGDKVVLLGGDNYRIGMGGGAVSSVATGEFNNAIELNAVQRSNPEMQKRAYNAIRALGEMDENPIVSIHDHGAGGHLNCLSELVEATGGIINIDKLPKGDPTLSAKEMCGNESQERMGLVLHSKDIDTLKNIAERERAPMYVIGEATGDMQFTFTDNVTGEKPIDLQLDDMFGNPPKTIITDNTRNETYQNIDFDDAKIEAYLTDILQLESVACKDYLTNKVDRSVTGKVAKQQCAGPLQLPLNNLGVVNFDYNGKRGIANSLGHAPVSGLANPAAGSVLSIAEALTNIIWAPLEMQLDGISLSANWMWPCKNPGEDARLYEAVKAASSFAIALGINIPTGKDSLSMTQKYKDGSVVYSPGTVIITAAAEVSDITKIVEPVIKPIENTNLYYIDFGLSGFNLGGSSFAQIKNKIGNNTPNVTDAQYFKLAFNTIQNLILEGKILAGHDISAGGLITTLLEMNFANTNCGMNVNISAIPANSFTEVLFSENPGIIIQSATDLSKELSSLKAYKIGTVSNGRTLEITRNDKKLSLQIDSYRDIWFKTSYLLDRLQCGETLAKARFENYKKHKLEYTFPASFKGTLSAYGLESNRKTRSGIKAAIIREKGVNGDREMAWAMHLAGFDVKDVHMTDLIAGRETLEDINFIVYVGGFSNSDVLGSAKGWAGAFLYNTKAKEALDKFYARKDTMSLGVCNGCQLMIELGLIYPEHKQKPKMEHNESHKFESIFLSVQIQDTNSIMLESLKNTSLGIWVAHGEGKFNLPLSEDNYSIAIKYSHGTYPANPNGSQYNTAGLCSTDGRHLAMMPHLERAIYSWNWAYYDQNRTSDEVSPWIEAFINARKWIANATK